MIHCFRSSHGCSIQYFWQIYYITSQSFWYNWKTFYLVDGCCNARISHQFASELCYSVSHSVLSIHKFRAIRSSFSYSYLQQTQNLEQYPISCCHIAIPYFWSSVFSTFSLPIFSLQGAFNFSSELHSGFSYLFIHSLISFQLSLTFRQAVFSKLIQRWILLLSVHLRSWSTPTYISCWLFHLLQFQCSLTIKSILLYVAYINSSSSTFYIL